VHGAAVVVASRGRGRREGDALVTDDDGLALALLGADCALVAMASPEGVRAVAHVGWRGLMAGVIGETATAMRRMGATEIEACSSPAIHAECYAFSPVDLEPIVARFGHEVASRTRDAAPALDLPAALAIDCARSGLHLGRALAGCTACDPRFYSWRARQDHARHALVCFAPAP
jgi:copper oxidase (laccase) domain-containing protein